MYLVPIINKMSPVLVSAVSSKGECRSSDEFGDNCFE